MEDSISIQKSFDERFCAFCGAPFTRNNGSQKYCSINCRNKAQYPTYKERKKAESVLKVIADPEVFLKKPHDPSRSYYKQKLEEQQRLKAEATMMDLFRVHPKIDWSKDKRRIIIDTISIT